MHERRDNDASARTNLRIHDPDTIGLAYSIRDIGMAEYEHALFDRGNRKRPSSRRPERNIDERRLRERNRPSALFTRFPSSSFQRPFESFARAGPAVIF